MQGDDVALLHSELAQLRAAGLLDAEIGRAEVAERRFGASTREAVVLFQRQHGLRVSGVVEEQTARRINEQVDGLSTRLERLLVRGQIHRDGRPFAGGLVRAFDQDMRREKLLGEAATDAEGRYEITYSSRQFARAGKERADLRVSVFTADGRALKSSPVLFNAATSETVDLHVETAGRAASEYERYIDALTPVMNGVALAELTEEDRDFLRQRTGIDEQHLGYLTTAAQHGKETGLPAEIFYGLYRQGLATSLSSLLGAGARAHRRALEDSLRGKIIPAAVGDQLETLLEELRQSLVRRSFEFPENGQRPPIVELLATTSLPRSAQEAFVGRYLEHEGPIEALWDALREHPAFRDDAQLDDLQLTLRLGLLTQGNPGLVRALKERLPGATASLRDLARLDEAQWSALIDRLADGEGDGIPRHVAGETREERRDHYARSIVETLEAAFPTTFIGLGLAREQGLDTDPVHMGLVRFFENEPDFELSGTRIDTYLAEHDAALAGVSSAHRAAVIDRLKATQRIFRVVPRYEHLRVLMQAGLDSAHAIANYPKRTFVHHFGEALGGESRAVAYYARAQQIAATSTTAYASIYQGLNDVLPYAVGGSKALQRRRTESIAKAANWPSLFGRIDLCACEHCRSLYSPAAYFVDLLEFLRKSLPLNGKTPLNVLLDRRPDLEHIKLTCENTTTPLPYVDLVNEVLEYYVANGALTKDAARDTEDSTAEALSVNPQHTIDAAYEVLGGAVYPLTLPFNRPLEIVRAYLAHVGSSRHQVMGMFQANGQASDIELACEYLHLSPEERGILTGSTAVPLHAFYGFGESDSNDWQEGIAALPELLRRTGVSYGDVLALLRTRVVNPDATIVLTLAAANESAAGPVDACNPANLKLDGLDAAALSRMHRFIRLQRKLDWAIPDLDKTFTALAAVDLDDGFLHKLAHVVALHRELKLPLVPLLSLWADIDSDGEEALYPKLFLNKTVINPVDPAFTLSELGTASAGITAHVPAILAALRIGEAELSAMRAALGLADHTAPLTLSNLSALHRRALLARGLKLKVQDLLALEKLSGIDPFQAADPASTVAFVQVVRKVRTSEFAAPELNYLYRHLMEPARPLGPAQEHIDQLARQLETGLARIADETNPVPDPSGEQIHQKLSLLWDEAAIAPFMVLLLGSSTYGTPMSALPASMGFPDALQGKVTYDVQAQVLRFVGPMTVDEQSALLNLSSDQDYQNAVGALFAQPRDLLAAILSDPKLDTAFLDLGDATDKLLDHAPTTTEEKFGYVLEHLLPYLRETLSRGLIVQTLSTALNLEPATTRLLVADVLHMPGDPTQPAMADFLPFDAASFPANYRRLHKAALLIKGFALTTREVAYLAANPADFAGFDLNGLPLARTDPVQTDSDAVPLFAQWLRLHDFATLRDGLPGREVGLIDVFEAAAGADPNGLSQAVTAALVEATGWDETELAHLTGPDGFGLTDTDFRNEKWLLRLQDAMKLSKRLGISTRKLFDWAVEAPDAGRAANVVQTVKAKYEDAQWLTVAKPLNDALRKRQRSALVARVLADAGIVKEGITTSNQLFEYFLIDVEMDPCMKTSRIKQANSSVQLFVQRCLMNLERQVRPEALDDEQWQWMKNYRVWEANRKVFLYPENWIEPELRDDKSPFFKELESELLQNELGRDTAERAIRNYLYKLDEVARLDIVGMYWQKREEGDTRDILHVFGRTFNSPHIHYYRRLNADTGVWTAWEKVNLDIAGDDDGVHLIPVVWNRRLYLFWPIFTEKPAPSQPSTGAPVKEWEIRMAWSEYEHTGWSPKQVTASGLVSPARTVSVELDYVKMVQDGGLVSWVHFPLLSGPPPAVLSFLPSKEGHYFGAKLHEGGLSLMCYRRYSVVIEGSTDWNAHTWKGEGQVLDHDCVGVISFDGGNASGKAADVMSPIPFGMAITSTGVNSFMNLSPLKEHLQHGFSMPPATQLLDKAPSIYRFVNAPTEADIYPALHSSQNIFYPFAYQDADKAYVVTKVKKPSQFQLDPFGSAASKPSSDVGAFIEQAMQQMEAPSRGVPGGGLLRFTPGSDSGGFATISTDRSKEKEILQRGLQALTRADAAASNGSPGWAESDKDGLVTLRPADQFKDKSIARFSIFFHPHVCSWIKALHQAGMEGLLRLDSQRLSNDQKPRTVFLDRYLPTHRVNSDLPREDVDFRHHGAYSLYNWELFFHIPMRIATSLSQDQRFEEAVRWFHFIFNPTASAKGSAPARYWNFLPFHENSSPESEQIHTLLQALNAGDEDMKQQVAAWRSNPFNPHLIARARITAYQKNVVMKYIDNLIAWGDQLFSRDTIESINEATQLYVLAANMLGPRPERIPAAGMMQPQTYASLKAKQLDAFSNALVEMETAFPFGEELSDGSSPDAQSLNLGTTFYFCIPQNDKLLGYWDTVEDRLFKVRHCMNIEGTVRELPLFEPPIDPALLVRAFAMGLDISSVLDDLSAPIPRFRFNLMAQKAIELSNDVKALGAALLAALEKKDSEALAVLRSRHELSVLNAVTEIRKRQIEEARESLEGIRRSKGVIEARRDYYRDMVKINANEQSQLDALGEAHVFNQAAQLISSLASSASATPNLDVGTAPGGPGGGHGPVVKASYGGSNAGAGLQAIAALNAFLAAEHSYDATMASIRGGYGRRWDDWKLQEKLADKELDQIDRQIAGAEIRLAMAEQELRNHDLQIENTKAVDDYMRSKYTNGELYGWMVGQLSAVYFQSYKLAYDVAKRAERAFRFERGLTDSSFIQFGYWDSLRKGLLSGEKLHYDLKRMEIAYLDQNRREYEITKHVSLVLHDPMALIAFKATGQCVVELPEALFDMDYPGHYMRRIKSVSLTIPCVTGPYTSINCTLTLLKNRIRVDGNAQQDYAEQDQDPRFVTNFAAIQSIATSHGRSDTGLFELNFRDERYLPFEGAGVDSRWRIEMPKECNALDFGTISDVILGVSYTARDGGTLLRKKAIEAATLPVPPQQSSAGLATTGLPEQAHLRRLFSGRHEFSSEWHRFLHPHAGEKKHSLMLDLAAERFPYQYRGSLAQINRVDLFVALEEGVLAEDLQGLKITVVPPQANLGVAGDLASVPTVLGGMLHATFDVESEASGYGTWTLEVLSDDLGTLDASLRTSVNVGGEWVHHLKANVVRDFILVCHYLA
jgi:hypothetical protein